MAASSSSCPCRTQPCCPGTPTCLPHTHSQQQDLCEQGAWLGGWHGAASGWGVVFGSRTDRQGQDHGAGSWGSDSVGSGEGPGPGSAAHMILQWTQVSQAGACREPTVALLRASALCSHCPRIPAPDAVPCLPNAPSHLPGHMSCLHRSQLVSMGDCWAAPPHQISTHQRKVQAAVCGSAPGPKPALSMPCNPCPSPTLPSSSDAAPHPSTAPFQLPGQAQSFG